MMIPSSKMGEIKRKKQLKKKDEIHLRYTNLACEVTTEHSERRYSAGRGRPEYIHLGDYQYVNLS